MRSKNQRGRFIMFMEDLAEHLQNMDNILSEDSCAGFPYLSLKKCDYSLKNTDSAYKDYVQLIKKYGYEDKWENGKVSFFDIHPVFSNASTISGIMGLHLSLTLFDKNIAGTSQTLYFDTASNWLKFTKISDKRIFALASWMRFDQEALYGDEADEFVSEDDNQFIYTKNSIFLIKGNELANIHQKPPTVFDTKLLAYYQENPHLLKKAIDHRSVLENEVNLYAEFISASLSNQSRLRDSALYLFMVIFCREFGINHEIFNSLNLEYGYKFDFSEDTDILQYTELALAYLDDLRIKIGEYSEIDITFTQIDVDISSALSSEQIYTQPLLEEIEPKSHASITPIIEYRKNYSIGGVRKFYEMKPALEPHEIPDAVYSEWRDITFCFLHNELDQEYYNKLRSIMDTHVSNEIERSKLTQYRNYDFQMAAIKKSAFNIFQLTMFDHFKLNNDECSVIAKNIFSRLKMPKLTPEQEREKNILNSKSQLDYIKKVHEDLLIKLNLLLQQSIGKIAHPSFLDQLGDSLSGLDHETLKEKIIYWYVINYVESYLEISNEYTHIYSLIEEDANNFAKNDAVNKSLLKEVKSFVRTRYDPTSILDFTINY